MNVTWDQCNILWLKINSVSSLKETKMSWQQNVPFLCKPTTKRFFFTGFTYLTQTNWFFNQNQWNYCVCLLKSFKSVLSICKQLDASYWSDVARMLLVVHYSRYCYDQFTHNAALQMKVSVEFRVLAASCIKETGYTSRKSCFNVQTCLCISILMFLIKVSILKNCE